MFISRFRRSSMTKHSGGLEGLHDRAELLDVLGVDLDVEDVDVGELLEEDALALHHRLAGGGADVAEAEHGRAVGDDRHQVPARGVRVGELLVLLDLQAGLGDARAVGEGQVAGGGAGLRRDDLDLPGPAAGVVRERLLLADLLAGGHGVLRGRIGGHQGLPSVRFNSVEAAKDPFSRDLSTKENDASVICKSCKSQIAR
jgi:hypothetical protein